MKKILILALMAMSVGCTKVSQGEFGIVQHFGGSIGDEPAGQGFTLTILDSLLVVDGTEVRVPMENLSPKDKDGVLFSVDLTVTYKINPEKAIGFYKQTHEVDRVEQNNERTNVLGFKIMQDVVANSTSKAFTEFTVSEIGVKKAEIEDKLKTIVQQKIDSRYADAFVITNVNINKTKLGDAVETVLQSQAIAKSQRALIELQKELADKENELINKKLNGLKEVARQTGVSLEKLMQYKLTEQYNSVLSEVAKNQSGKVQIQMNSKDNDR